MRCPACGAEVVQQAVYCHKCGERLTQDESFLPNTGAETATASVAADPARGNAPPLDAPDRVRSTVAANHLAEDEQEKELWRGGYSSKAMVGIWVLTGLITVVLLAVWIGFHITNSTAWIALAVVIGLLWLYQLLVLVHRRMNVRYLLTTQRFLFEKGLLRRVTDCVEVVEINDITFEQGLLERLVGVGTIRVTSGDRSSPEVVMPGIENVQEVSRTMDEVRRNERRRRGLHIEAL